MTKISRKRLILYKFMGSLINVIFITLVLRKFQFIELEFKYSLESNYFIYTISVFFITYAVLYEQKKEEY